MCPIRRISSLIHSKEKTDKEILLAYFLAPLITGIKPSTILTFKKNTNGLYEYWMDFSGEFLNSYGFACTLISVKKDQCQILFYDIHNLSEHLRMEKHQVFLSRFGYTPCATFDCLTKLAKKMKDGFPHESGIFFGIPLDDVKAYMDNKDFIYQGYWKVYQEERVAEKIFHYYDASKHLILSYSNNELLPRAKNKFLKQKNHLYA